MKTLDVLYHWNEPPSFGAFALEDAKLDGIVINAIPMPTDTKGVLWILRRSAADAILCISPAQYSSFFKEAGNDLKGLGKPLLDFATEWCFGNALTSYGDFETGQDLFDVYFCGQACDCDEMTKMGRKAFVSPIWASHISFRQGPPLSKRIQKCVFIGDTKEYAPGVYSNRRRMLSALAKRDLVDVLNIPKTYATAHIVAHAYASYAGVFCPESNGYAQGIRVYEAAAAGALVIEAQRMDARNEWFETAVHRIGLDPHISDDEIQKAVEGIEFSDFQDIADAGARLVREDLAATQVLSRMVHQAASALDSAL